MDDLLRAQDSPAQTSEEEHARGFVNNSATIRQMEHSAESSGTCGVAHTKMLSAGNAPGFVEYKFQWQYDLDGPNWGAGHKMPVHIPEVLRRALLMQRLCEWSIIVLQPLIKMLVQKSTSTSSTVCCEQLAEFTL